MNSVIRCIKILLAQDNPLKFIISRFLKYSGLWRFVKVKRDGYVLKLHPASLSLSLWVDPSNRELDSFVLKTLLDEGDVYVDVGANIGHLAIEASLIVGDRGTVYAFEAHPTTEKFLRENIAINNIENIIVGQFAVGHEFGWVSFSNMRSDDMNRILNVGDRENHVVVPMVRLEEFFSTEEIKLLKIDVEGFEKFVLEGLGNFLDNVDNVYFEVMDSHFAKYGYAFSDIYDLLIRRGFKVIKPGDDSFEIIERNRKFSVCINLLAVKSLSYVERCLGNIEGLNHG